MNRSKWSITKEFGFDYGHRVWTQQLNGKFSLDTQCACRHLHGHRGRLEVSLTAPDLNEQGMITDFKHLNFVKKFVDDVLDHKMILDIDDPALTVLFPLATKENIENIGMYSRIKFSSGFGEKLRKKAPTPEAYAAMVEVYDGLVLVPFVPTSENLSRWLYQYINEQVAELGVSVDKILLYETPKSKSEYFEY